MQSGVTFGGQMGLLVEGCPLNGAGPGLSQDTRRASPRSARVSVCVGHLAGRAVPTVAMETAGGGWRWWVAGCGGPALGSVTPAAGLAVGAPGALGSERLVPWAAGTASVMQRSPRDDWPVPRGWRQHIFQRLFCGFGRRTRCSPAVPRG